LKGYKSLLNTLNDYRRGLADLKDEALLAELSLDHGKVRRFEQAIGAEIAKVEGALIMPGNISEVKLIDLTPTTSDGGVKSYEQKRYKEVYNHLKE
jgi:hypothetical protein